MAEVNHDEQIAKRTIKDSVFTDFFRIPGNMLELYKVLHPEDKGVDIYKSKRVQIPKAELYVLYTGDRKKDHLK